MKCPVHGEDSVYTSVGISDGYVWVAGVCKCTWATVRMAPIDGGTIEGESTTMTFPSPGRY